MSSRKRAKYDQAKAPKPVSDSDSGSEDDGSDMETEKIEILQQRAFEKYVPEVREMLGDDKPEMLKDNQPRPCLVCQPRAFFKGWRALMAHASKFKKRKPQQHRGFYRALENVVNPSAQHGAPKIDLASTRVNGTTASLAARQVVWPPVLSVRGSSTEQVRQLVLQVIHDNALDKIQALGRDLFLVVLKDMPLSMAEVSNVKDHRIVVLEPDEMNRIDPLKEVVAWCSTTKADVTQRLRDSNRDDMLVAQQVQASKLQDHKLDEDQEKLGFSKLVFSNRLKEKEEEMKCLLEAANREEADRARRDEQELLSFERDMRHLEEAKVREEQRMWKVLQSSSKKTAEQKTQVEIHNQRLKVVLKNRTTNGKELNQKYLRLQAQKEALEKKCFANHAGMDDNFRQEETRLEADLERQLKLLEEEYQKEQSEVLNDHLKNAMESKEKACIICMEDFCPTVKRGILRPCGHARACIDCSLAIFETRKKECPICRQPIKSKPLATTVDQVFL